MALLSNEFRAGNHLPYRAVRLRHAVMALSFVAALSASAAGQEKRADAKSERKADSSSNEDRATPAT